jgi:hypothetical protein
VETSGSGETTPLWGSGGSIIKVLFNIIKTVKIYCMLQNQAFLKRIFIRVISMTLDGAGLVFRFVVFGRTGYNKITELQLVMLYEPVHCISFPLLHFLQAVEIPEEYSPS